MKSLGISFPRWLENELRHSADTLERSVDLCERVFTDVQDYAREKHLPIGINVESVSIRRSEIDASVELYRRDSLYLSCRQVRRPSHGPHVSRKRVVVIRSFEYSGLIQSREVGVLQYILLANIQNA